MLSIALLTAAVSACSAGQVDGPYERMQRGFETRDPAMVASAYASTAVLGDVDEPRVRGKQRMVDTFGYVAPDDGSTLAIDFKIIYRNRGEGLVGDVGLYRITSEGRDPDYGQFTTVTTCGDDGVWRFIADLMVSAGEAEWTSASCVQDGMCAE